MPQVVVVSRMKSPEIAGLLMVIDLFAILVNVTVFAKLVVPTFCELNERVVGLMVTAEIASVKLCVAFGLTPLAALKVSG